MERLCERCYWNSALNFFEGEFDTRTGKWVEVCVRQLPRYPYAKVCAQFEQAHEVDGD
jgi:hypothetical protein